MVDGRLDRDVRGGKASGAGARLVLFDSAGLYEKPEWNTDLFTPVSAIELDQFDALLMPHPPAVPSFVAADILRVSRKRAWLIHRALDSMLTGRDTTDKLLPQLKMPVLIVWGALDHITPLEPGREDAPADSAIADGGGSDVRTPRAGAVRGSDRVRGWRIF